MTRTIDDEADKLREVRDLLNKAMALIPTGSQSRTEVDDHWDSIVCCIGDAQEFCETALKEIGATP